MLGPAMNKNHDPLSSRPLLGGLIVTIVGTVIAEAIWASIKGEFAVSSALLILLICGAVFLAMWAVPILRRFFALIGKLAHTLFQWIVRNWQLPLGLLLFVCAVGMASWSTRSIWPAVLALGLAPANALFSLWLRSVSQRRSQRSRFEVIPLSPGVVANAKVEDKYLDPPLGDVSFGGVRFRLGSGFSVFDTAEQIRQGVFSDGTTKVSLKLPKPVGQVKSVHLLINARGGWKSQPETGTWLEGSKIGGIDLVFAHRTSQSTDLILGRNIREWAIGNAPDRLVSKVTDSACHLAWRGSSYEGKYAVIDRLEIPVLAPNRGKELESIVFIRDIPQHPEFLGTSHLHFFVSAVTLETELRKQRG